MRSAIEPYDPATLNKRAHPLQGSRRERYPRSMSRPIRADHVGSLLRPRSASRARERVR